MTGIKGEIERLKELSSVELDALIYLHVMESQATEIRNGILWRKERGRTLKARDFSRNENMMFLILYMAAIGYKCQLWPQNNNFAVAFFNADMPAHPVSAEVPADAMRIAAIVTAQMASGEILGTD